MGTNKMYSNRSLQLYCGNNNGLFDKKGDLPVKGIK